MQVIRMLPPHLNTTNSQGTNDKHVTNSQRTQYICNNTRETSNKHFTNTQRTQQTGNSTNSRSRLFFYNHPKSPTIALQQFSSREKFKIYLLTTFEGKVCHKRKNTTVCIMFLKCFARSVASLAFIQGRAEG